MRPTTSNPSGGLATAFRRAAVASTKSTAWAATTDQSSRAATRAAEEKFAVRMRADEARTTVARVESP